MSYPASLDNFTPKTDSVDNVVANDVNELQTAVEAIETELGTDPAGSATDLKTRLAHSLSDAGMLEFDAATELTISSGAITVTQNYHKVDTEGDGATDDLVTINGGAAGMFVVLRPENSSRDITIKHGSGNIRTAAGTDLTLTNIYALAFLVYDAALGYWLAFMGSGIGSGGADALYSKWDVDCPPSTANALDDEFDDSSFNSTLWTEVDFNTDLTVAEGDYGLALTRNGGDGGDVMGVFQDCATAEYTFVAKINYGWYVESGAAQPHIGVALIEGTASTDLGLCFSMYSELCASFDEIHQRIGVYSATVLSAVGAAVHSTAYRGDNSGIFGGPTYFRVRDDGTNLTFDYSRDGWNWVWIYQSDKVTLGITPAKIGIFMQSGENTETLYCQFARTLDTEVANSAPVAGRKVSVYG